MKKYRFNIIILLLISFLVIYFSTKDDISGVYSYINKIDYLWVFVAIFFTLLNIFFQCLALYPFLKEVKKDYKISSCFKLLLCAQFFNGITPFSSGGQPFQIYILKKEGMKVSDSASSLIQTFITYQMALTILGAFSILMNNKLNLFNATTLKNIVLIGFIINISIMVLIIFFSRTKKINQKLSNKIFDFIFNFKFIKNASEKKEKALESLDNFYNSASLLKNNLKNTTFSLFSNLLSLIFLYMVPFFIFYSLDEQSITLTKSIIASGYTYLIGSFIPVPGAAGGLEYSFVDFFGIFTKGTKLTVIMLLWRIITYYLMMILGGVTLLFKKRRSIK